MKKHYSKIMLLLFVALSFFCLDYINSYNSSERNSLSSSYEEFSNHTDQMVGRLQTATIVMNKVVDFLTKREAS